MKYDRHLNTSDFDPFLQNAIDIIEDKEDNGITYYELKELVKSENGKNHNAVLVKMSEPPSWALFEEGWYFSEDFYVDSSEYEKYHTKFYIYTKADGTITRAGYLDIAGVYTREWTKQEIKEKLYNKNFSSFNTRDEWEDWEKGTAPSWAE